jgi:hypothetical protein
VNIDGWKIKDNGTENHSISNGGTLNILAGSFLVLGRNSNSSTNGGVTVDYQYSSFQLTDVSDAIILTLADDTEVDRVEYNNATWPMFAGHSMYFATDPSQDNNIASNGDPQLRLMGVAIMDHQVQKERGYLLNYHLSHAQLKSK